jgi:hypothetical protein
VPQRLRPRALVRSGPGRFRRNRRAVAVRYPDLPLAASLHWVPYQGPRDRRRLGRLAALGLRV